MSSLRRGIKNPRFMRGFFLWVWFAIPAHSSAQDHVLELAAVEVCEGDLEDSHGGNARDSRVSYDDRIVRAQVISFENAPHGLDVDEALGQLAGARVSENGGRLQRQTVAFRGAGAQDVAVSYRSVGINALSDGSADLSLIPAELLSEARLMPTGVGSGIGVGGSIDLVGSKSPVLGSVRATTLGDFGLFVQSPRATGENGLEVAAFGDASLGEYGYLDEQGTSQWRRHNRATRVGGQVAGQFRVPGARVEGFSFFGAIDRQEPGVSEYPASFRRAAASQWMSLTGVHVEGDAFAVGSAYLILKGNASHRVAARHYENPTSYIGGKRTESDDLDNQTRARIQGEFYEGLWGMTSVTLGYDGQHISTEQIESNDMWSAVHVRHLVSLEVAQKAWWLEERLRLHAGVRAEVQVDGDVMVSPVLGVAFRLPPWLDVWASVSMSERRPTFDELYYRTEFMRGNADLKNQRSVLDEVGVSFYVEGTHDASYSNRVSWDGFARLSVVGFYNYHWDLIRFVPVMPHLFVSKNIGAAHARGIEVDGELRVWRGLGMRARYAWVDARTRDGYVLATAPEHHAWGGLYWQGPRVMAEFRVDYLSRMARTMAGTSYTPARWRLDMDVTYRVNSHVSVSLVMRNLLDDRQSEDVFQRPLPGFSGGVVVSFENP